MNNSTLMLAAVMDGALDDATICAALDALREEMGMSMLAAVIEVARVRRAHVDAGEMAEAARMLRSGSSLRGLLHGIVATECPGAREDSSCTIMLEEGERWPYLVSLRLDLPFTSSNRQHIGVGAGWIVQRGRQIRVQMQERRAEQRAAKSK